MPALRTRDVNPAPTSASLPASLPSPPSSPTSPQDASQTQTLTAPALQLISPTPRTLLFPTSHSLSLGALDASPYSSPSHSPFQGADSYEAGFEYDAGNRYEGHVGIGGGGGGANYDNGNGNAGFEYGAYDKFDGQSATFTFTSQTNDSSASLSFYQQQHANGSSASFHSQPYHIESPSVSHSTTQHTAQHTTQHTAQHTAQHPVSHFTQQKAGSQLSLTIPELPNFAPQPYSSGASPGDVGSDSASLRSSSPSGSVHSHKRRKSTSTTRRDASTERRPKKGDADYVKRPENAFILFRRAACEERQAAEAEAQSRGGAPAKKQRQADLSKAISERWRSLSGDEKRVWEERAKEKKEEHAKANPGYVYRPERKSKKSVSAATSSSASTSQRRPSLSRARRGSEDSSTSLDSPHLSVFVPMRMPSSHSSSHHHAHSASVSLSAGSSLDAPHLQSNGGGVHRNGRSSSAPRPYHRIDVPLVNHGMGIGLGGRFKREGSEPTSPSLVPLINEHSRQGGGWDYVPPTKSFTLPGSSEYPSMSMVSSLFQQNTNTSTPAPANGGRKSSAPSPLQQIAMQHASSGAGAPSGPSPLSLIAPPPNTVSSTLTSKAPLDAISTTTNGNGNGSDGSESGNSSPQTGPFTPSALAPSAFMMPNFETLLEPPSSSTFDGLIDPSLQDMPSSHMRMNMSDGGMGEDLDPMGMTGIEGMDDYGMGMGMGMGIGMSFGGGMGGVGAFGSWDWPAGEGTLDNNWDVNSIPLASLSPSSLSSPPLSSASLASPPNSSSLSPPNSSNSNSNSNGGSANGSATSQLAAQFGSMGVGNGNGKGVGAYDHGEGMYGTMGDPTLMVGGYDDILAGGAFA